MTTHSGSPGELGCLLGGGILRYAQALPSCAGPCSYCPGAPPKLDDFYCRETEFVKDRNSLLAPTACLNRKECLDKNLREK